MIYSLCLSILLLLFAGAVHIHVPFGSLHSMYGVNEDGCFLGKDSEPQVAPAAPAAP